MLVEIFSLSKTRSYSLLHFTEFSQHAYSVAIITTTEQMRNWGLEMYTELMWSDCEDWPQS